MKLTAEETTELNKLKFITSNGNTCTIVIEQPLLKHFTLEELEELLEFVNSIHDNENDLEHLQCKIVNRILELTDN